MEGCKDGLASSFIFQFGVIKKDPTSTLVVQRSRVAAAAIKEPLDAVQKPQHLVCNGPVGAH